MGSDVIGDQIPRSRGHIRRWLARGLMRLLGWRTEVVLPNIPQMVLVAAPHTSNWDGVYAVCTVLALELRIAIFAKHTLFRWPFGGFLRWVGLMPVDRSAKGGLVGQTTEAFNSNPQLLVCLAAEGTRKRAENWKSGFWQIARAANVPIVCAYLDYKRKVCGIGPVIMPTDDFQKDLAEIQRFYRTISPHTPENFATMPGL